MVLVIDVSHVGYSCVVGSWLVGEGKNLYRLMLARGVYIVVCQVTYGTDNNPSEDKTEPKMTHDNHQLPIGKNSN